MPATQVAGTFLADLIDLRFVAVQHLVPHLLDPFADLIERHELLHVEAVPAADLIELLLPALVRRLRRGTEAEDVDDRELLRYAEQRAHGLLRCLLADCRHPPYVIAESGCGEMRGHGRSRYALQQDALGVLVVLAVEIAAVHEHWKSASEAEVRDHHDHPGCRLQPAVVRRGKLHLELGAAALLLDEIVGDLFLRSGIGDDDVMPGLRVSARGGMARGFEDEIVVLARHDATGIELARGEPVAHHFEQSLAAGVRGGLGHFMPSNHFLSDSSRTTLAEGFSSRSAASMRWNCCEILSPVTWILSASSCACRIWSASFLSRSSNLANSSESRTSASLMTWICLRVSTSFSTARAVLSTAISVVGETIHTRFPIAYSTTSG